MGFQFFRKNKQGSINKILHRLMPKMKTTGVFILMLALLMSSMSLSLAADTGSGASEPIYIGFTSDVHGRTDNLETWISNLGAPTLKHMVFGGDYEGTSTAQSCKSIVKGKYDSAEIVLARGNHDPKDKSVFSEGLVYNEDDYAIYVLDSGGTDGFNTSFDENEINDLSTKLSNIASSKPVFVVSHGPIHYFNNRATGNAGVLLNELNQYENVIFLWGHNHTNSDPYYGDIMTKGFELKTTSTGTGQTINFTYLSFGSMKEGANKGTYGLLATINKYDGDTIIKFDFKNTSGGRVSNSEITIKGIGNKTVETVYEPVSSPEDGETYVVVAKTGNDYYALTTEKHTSGSTNYLKATSVEVSGSYITSKVNDNMLWLFEYNKVGYNIVNASKYLTRQSGGASGISLETDKKEDTGYVDWVYTESEKSLRTESTKVDDKFYLNLNGSGSNYYFGNLKNDSSEDEIYLYKLGEGLPPIGTYTVSFNSNGGSVIESIEIEKGKAIRQLPVPTKSGYIFAYWYAVDGENEEEFTEDIPVISNITLYAKWIERQTGETVYELVSSPEDGETYVIVGKYGDDYYAMTTEKYTSSDTDYLKGEKVIQSNDYLVSAVDDNMLWHFTISGDGFNVINDSYYLNRQKQGSASIYTSTTRGEKDYSDWIYSESSFYTYSNSVSKNFYLYTASSSNNIYFGNTNEDSGNPRRTEIYIYKVTQGPPIETYTVSFNSNGGSVIESTEIEKGKTIKQLPVPTKSGYTFAGWYTVDGENEEEFTEDIPVTSNITVYAKWVEKQQSEPSDPIFIGFTSDVHGEIDTLEEWIDNLKTNTPVLDSMVFGGDYPIDRNQTGENDSVSMAEKCRSIVKDAYGDDLPVVLVRGNHDPQGDSMYPSGPQDFGEYAIFVLDSAGQNSATATFIEKEIIDLDSFLSKTNKGKPVFVVSHCPLHYYKAFNMERSTENADELINVLNKHNNVIFVWAHYHTLQDPSYGTINRKGHEIQTTARNDSIRTLNFTYLSSGAIKDGAGQNIYGLIAILEKVGKDIKVTFKYKDKQGNTKSEGTITIEGEEPELYTITFNSNGGSAVAPIIAEAGENIIAPSNPTRTGYNFKGWEPNLPTHMPSENITVYAKWEKKSSSGGSSGSSSSGGGGGSTKKDPAPVDVPKEEIPEGDAEEAFAKEKEHKEIIPYPGFEDVDKNAWYYEPIKFVVESGLFKGTSEKLFSPDGIITRGMFVTILSRLEFGSDDKVPVHKAVFTDLTQDWYKNAVAWAHKNEITLGVSETEFNPDGVLTREQMVVMLYRYAKYKGYDVNYDKKVLDEFDDKDSISDYALEAMSWALQQGLITGVNETTLAPKQQATRAQSATIFMRFIVSLEEGSDV